MIYIILLAQMLALQSLSLCAMEKSNVKEIQEQQGEILKKSIVRYGITNLTHAWLSPTSVVYKGGKMSRNQQDQSLVDVQFELEDKSTILRSFEIQNLAWAAQATDLMLSDYVPCTKDITGGYKILFESKEVREKFITRARELQGELPQPMSFSGNRDHEKPHEDDHKSRFVRTVKYIIGVSVVVVLGIMLYRHIKR